MSILNLKKVFCKISARITVFRWKIAAVNLNFQEKFYDSGASKVLGRLAVSAELPAILEKYRRVSEKIDRATVRKMLTIIAFKRSNPSFFESVHRTQLT